jgi:tetratricopeptide (TPR) repeat protein
MTIEDHEATRARAAEALSRGQFEEAIAGATTLVEAGEPWLVDGLVRRAMALEGWAVGADDRLERAAMDWRRLTEYASAEIAYRSLARVQLKLGDRAGAFQNLQKAERIESTPELMLGFAEYYRTASPANLELARTYYLRAAKRGRTKGMLGYVETAYELDQPLAAAGMVLMAVIAMPFLMLFLRSRRHAGF